MLLLLLLWQNLENRVFAMLLKHRAALLVKTGLGVLLRFQW